MQLHRLSQLSDIDNQVEFERELVRLGQDMGFGLLLALVVTETPGGAAADARVARLGNVPEKFLHASIDREQIERDPVSRRLKALSVPVIYDQATYVAADAGDLWDHQAAFGYRTGIAVALHLPGNRHFVLGLDREETLPSEHKLVSMLGELQLLAVHAQEGAMRLFSQQTEAVKLTEREIEVVRLTVQGQSAKVVARALDCSVATVHFHLANIRRKLGVQTKHQAARLAESMGLL